MRVISLLVAAPALFHLVCAQDPAPISISSSAPFDPTAVTSDVAAMVMPAIASYVPDATATDNAVTAIAPAIYEMKPVPCKADADCSDSAAFGMPFCHEGTCGPCTTVDGLKRCADMPMVSPGPMIEPMPISIGEAIDCKTDGDCSGHWGLPFCSPEGRCSGCKTDDNGMTMCASAPLPPTVTLEDGGASTPGFNPDAVACKSNSDCDANSFSPYCTDGFCSPCFVTDGINSCARGGVAVPVPVSVTQEALVCQTAEDCTASGLPFCTQGVCSACQVDERGHKICAATLYTGEEGAVTVTNTDGATTTDTIKDSSMGNPGDVACTEASQCTAFGFPFCDQGKCSACQTNADGTTVCARTAVATGTKVETSEGSSEVPPTAPTGDASGTDTDADGVVKISAPVGDADNTNSGNTDTKVSDNKNDGFLSSKETQDGGVATTRDTPDDVDSGAGRNAAVWGVCGVVVAMLMM